MSSLEPVTWLEWTLKKKNPPFKLLFFLYELFLFSCWFYYFCILFFNTLSHILNKCWFLLDMKQKMVVIIIESSSEMPLEMLRENLTLWADMNHQEDSEYLEELSEESANDLLIQSAPPVLTADVERGVLKFKKRWVQRKILSLCSRTIACISYIQN